ncbi:RsmB/NOP family class I SAM-dependent RNA methyltransferase, partial [bacterium]|nr:RsmB/NOP family class I SAM-dependent RNA methyltransferase [bacterium]
LLGVPAAAAVSETVEALKMGESPEAAPLVNAVLRRIAAARPPLDPLATVPAWLLERWRRTYGEERARRLVEAALRPARPFLVALDDRAALAERLAAAGVETEPAARHPGGLVVKGGAPQETEEFAAGSFVLLDEGAALVALLAAPRDERPVADVAAAPGGKAALLAPLARGGLAALELHRTRARLLAASLRRTARPGERATAARADALRPPLRDGVFGLALLDAPCTGTGTLRKRPEKRDRLAESDVAECAARQAAMLERTAALVGPGGALVYAVCSLEPEEGEDVVRAFLAAHPEFAAEDPRETLGEAADGLVAGDPPLLRTRPDEEDTEGFVAARLVRRP